jgi:hypothetical protein
MAFALLNAAAWVHGYDFTTDTNKMAAAVDRPDLDATTFASGSWKTKAAGLLDVSAHLEGFWSGPADAEAFPDLGFVDRPLTVSPDGVAGSVAFLAQVAKFKYSTFGAVGELVPFALDAMGSNSVGVVRGRVAKAKGTVSATGVLGSGQNLGAPIAGQFAYAALHVFAPAPTTITVQIQSASDAPFTTPTVRGTIGPITTAGGTWMTRVAGPLAGEAFWRMNVTAITGTATVAGAVGVQ